MQRPRSPATGNPPPTPAEEARAPRSLRRFARAWPTPTGPHPGGPKPRFRREW